jgi:elongation factor P
MISTADFKNGVTIFVDKEPYQIIWFQNHKPGKGGAVMRTKMKHLRKGSIIERTFKSGERFDSVDVERRKKQYMYNDGTNYHFMDMVSFDQAEVPKEKLGEQANFLTENMEVQAVYLEGDLVDIEMPLNVVLTVAETEPGVRGDTVSNVMKPAKLETGADVRVPLFIKQGDKVRIDTRTGEYVERVTE